MFISILRLLLHIGPSGIFARCCAANGVKNEPPTNKTKQNPVWLCYSIDMRQEHKQQKEKKTRGKSPMDAALGYLGFRARSVREMERYLDEKQYGEYEIMQVIDRLMELGYLNDARFASDFVSSRLRTKPMSRRHLREQLKKHELPREVIEDALAEITDEQELDNAVACAEKYSEQYADLEERERSQRVTRRMLSRGFDYSTVRMAMEKLSMEAAEEALAETEE